MYVHVGVVFWCPIGAFWFGPREKSLLHLVRAAGIPVPTSSLVEHSFAVNIGADKHMLFHSGSEK